MNNSNLAEKLETKTFPEWDYLATETAKVFNLTRKEALALYNSNTAKIIAVIPFAAGCREPERTAIAHLCLYEAEIRGFQQFCAHLPSDDEDVFKRLDMISTFDDGNNAVIEHGMNILALIMLEGYNRSQEKDRLNGTYNPILSGKWNYDVLKKKLENKINEIDCPAIDRYYIPVKAYWVL